MDDDNLINLDLSISFGPPHPRPSPRPWLGRTEGHLDLNLRLFTPPTSSPPPDPSPALGSTVGAFTATRFHSLPYRFPFEESRRTEGDLDLNLLIFDIQTTSSSHSEPSPPPTSTADAFIAPCFEKSRRTFGDLDLSLRLAGSLSSESSPSPSHDSTAASTPAIEFESDSASSHPVQQRLPASSHPRQQQLPAESHPRQQRLPAASQVSPQTPQHPPYPLSNAASTSPPPSLQHPYPRLLRPAGRYSLVPSLGANSSSSSKSAPPVLGCVRPPPARISEIASSSASFPKRRLSDSEAMRSCISKPGGTPEASAAQRDIDPIRMEPSFPWARERLAGVRSLAELRRLNITKVKGRLRCNRCGQREEKEYEIEAEFNKLAAFVVAKEGSMNDRAPEEWTRPAAPECPNSKCGIAALTVEMPPAENVEEVNWLFMLLGRMLAQCNLKQLKYFCMHNGNLHRSGAKDRLLYNAYMTLCSQLDPDFRARSSAQEEEGRLLE